MNKTETLKMALQNLLTATRHLDVCPGTVEAAEAALAQPDHIGDATELVAREWVVLTDAERASRELLRSIGKAALWAQNGGQHD
jgi:hypothetical protein